MEIEADCTGNSQMYWSGWNHHVTCILWGWQLGRQVWTVREMLSDRRFFTPCCLLYKIWASFSCPSNATVVGNTEHNPHKSNEEYVWTTFYFLPSPFVIPSHFSLAILFPFLVQQPPLVSLWGAVVPTLDFLWYFLFFLLLSSVIKLHKLI